MSRLADMAERHGRTLADLAERGHALACRIQEDAMAAETPAERAELSVAFHRTARTVRQSMALEAKLERDRRLGEREHREQVAREAEAQVQARKARVKATVERLIWSEAEADDAERLVDALDHLLEEDALSDGFMAEAVDAYVARLRHDLGLEGEPGAQPNQGQPRGSGLFQRRGPGRRRDFAARPWTLSLDLQEALDSLPPDEPEEELEFDHGPAPPDLGGQGSG